MRIGASLFLIALGAILKFAFTKHINGVDVQTVGVILMVIGVVGLVIELILLANRRRTVVAHRPGVAYVDPVVRPGAAYVEEPIDPLL